MTSVYYYLNTALYKINTLLNFTHSYVCIERLHTKVSLRITIVILRCIDTRQQRRAYYRHINSKVHLHYIVFPSLAAAQHCVVMITTVGNLLIQRCLCDIYVVSFITCRWLSMMTFTVSSHVAVEHTLN